MKIVRSILDVMRVRNYKGTSHCMSFYIAVDSTETIARKYLYVCILSICDMSHIEKEAAYQSQQFVLTTNMMY